MESKDLLMEIHYMEVFKMSMEKLINVNLFRAYVISTLTHLKTMDFCAVTPDERALCHRKILVKEPKKSCQ